MAEETAFDVDGDCLLDISERKLCTRTDCPPYVKNPKHYAECYHHPPFLSMCMNSGWQTDCCMLNIPTVFPGHCHDHMALVVATSKMFKMDCANIATYIGSRNRVRFILRNVQFIPSVLVELVIQYMSMRPPPPPAPLARSRAEFSLR